MIAMMISNNVGSTDYAKVDIINYSKQTCKKLKVYKKTFLIHLMADWKFEYLNRQYGLKGCYYGNTNEKSWPSIWLEGELLWKH
jgi:hypothetical protein